MLIGAARYTEVCALGMISGQKEIKRPLYYFRPIDYTRMTGLEQSGVVHIKGAGGIKPFRDSPILRVSGRLLWPPRDDNQAVLMRNRELVLIARHGDPSPLSIHAGRARRYQGERVSADDVDRLNAEVVDLAVADHKREGGLRERLTTLLLVALIFTVLIAGLIWLAIPMTRLLM